MRQMPSVLDTIFFYSSSSLSMQKKRFRDSHTPYFSFSDFFTYIANFFYLRNFSPRCLVAAITRPRKWQFFIYFDILIKTFSYPKKKSSPFKDLILYYLFFIILLYAQGSRKVKTLRLRKRSTRGMASQLNTNIFLW